MENRDMILAEFRRRVVMTLGDFIELDNWAAITVRRHLKKWGALTSFNHNGRYYVLGNVPRFDAFGLWSYEGVRFSKFGNLTETILGLVGNSGSGMLASELSVLLGHSIHPFLARLVAKNCLARLRQRGGHIYFSSITRIRKEQEKSLLAREHAVAAEFPLANAVALLIEKIRNPVLEAGALAALLRGRGVILTEQEVYGFLSFHGLAKKK